MERTIPLDKLVSNLNEQLTLYRKQTNQMMLNTIDSHDTPRILTLAGGNKDLMRQVLAFLYLQQGIPCLYYGDEVGLDGGIDPDCRKCMIWNPEKQDLQLFEFVKQLIALRRENQFTLCEGSLEWQKVDTSTGTLIFSRDISNEKIIGIFNTGNHSIFEQASDEILMLQLANIKGDSIAIEPNGFVILKK